MSGKAPASRTGSGLAWIRALSVAPLLAISSQAVGMVQLVLMLLRHGATNATDVYLYLFNLGNLPNQVIAVGVLYPLLLSHDRLSRRRARIIRAVLPMSTVAVMALGAAWLQVNGRVNADTMWIALLCLVNALVQSGIWPLAVAAEASGDPRWMAGVALPANVLACVGLLPPWAASASQVGGMIGGLIAGNALMLAVLLSRRVGGDVYRSLPATDAGVSRAQWWFAAKSAVGYGGLILMQSIALTLPPSALTVIAVPTKVVGAISVALVNSMMPKFVHQESQSPELAARFLRALWFGILPFALGSIIVSTLWGQYSTSMTIIVVLWVYASTGAACAQRLAFRFLPASASTVTLVVLPLVVLATWLSSIFGTLTVAALLCGYAIVDAASGALWFRSLRLRPFAGILTAIGSVLAGVWVATLLMS